MYTLKIFRDGELIVVKEVGTIDAALFCAKNQIAKHDITKDQFSAKLYVAQRKESQDSDKTYHYIGKISFDGVFDNVLLNQAKAIALGHAVGDALGTPVEFESRQDLDVAQIDTMYGGGTYDMPKGTWSDGTSMALCGLEVVRLGNFVDLNKVMQNFCQWYFDAKFTATDVTFDVGGSCEFAIKHYQANQDITSCGNTHEHSNGNGSLMRIYPFVLHQFTTPAKLKEKLKVVEEASAITHGHDRSKIACGIYALVMWQLLRGKSPKDAVLSGIKQAQEIYGERDDYFCFEEMLFAKCGSVFDDDKPPYNYRLKVRDEIKSSGYVVHTLEAALWCLLTTNNYRDCVLKAVNLGDDTDTTAAVAGSLAGAVYGTKGIPQEWLDLLLKKDLIETLCQNAFEVL